MSPQGPPQSPKAIKNTTEISKLRLASVHIGKERNNHVKSVTCEVPLILPNLSPSWGGTTPIRHPRGLPQSPKATKNTTEISKLRLASVFIGKERKNHLKSVNCAVPLICPTPFLPWGGTTPICHSKGPPQSPKAIKNITYPDLAALPF